MPLFTGYVPHAKVFRNTLLQNPQNLHGSPPTTEELIALQDELNAIKSRTSARLQKATHDLELFQSKWAIAAKERERPPKEAFEKAREKAKSRIKREASGQPVTSSFPHIQA